NLNGANLNPQKMGVGHYAGLIRGGHKDYYNWRRTENGETRNVGKYATTAFTDEAIGWIKQNNSPWFLWLAYTAPHFPLHLPPAHLHNRQNLSGEKRGMRRNALSYYFAALEALDREMGRILVSMSKSVRANTLIIFLGDNGSPGRVAQLPFARRKAKGTLFEGGIRVPMVVQGAGVSRKGQREAALVNTTDIFATLGEIAQTNLAKASDSMSFKHLLSTAVSSKRKFLYSEQFNTNRPNQTNGWTIRNETHKLLVFEDGSEHLFDLRSDRSEERNLLEANNSSAQIIAKKLREKAKELRTN
ncbi:MAG: sulfatase-like hydrolase/transferase, partial [Rhizobiaceae bacterium]